MKDYYKILAFPNDSTVIIDYGYKDILLDDIDNINDYLGAEVLIVEKGIELVDPETGDFIGSYDPIKCKLEITEIFEKYSIARKVVRTSATQLITSPMFKNITKIEYKTLNIKPDQIQNINVENTELQIGNLVIIK